MTNNLDIKYAALVDQLQLLTDQLNTFINGTETDTIVTANGTVKSLAGIIKDLQAIRYIQKIKDHRLYADMTVDTDLAEGMLVRVWGDDVAVNGVYKVGVGTFTKITYADLYDLTQP